MPETTGPYRYMINDVDAAIAFYTPRVGFTFESNSTPVFAYPRLPTAATQRAGQLRAGAACPMEVSRSLVVGIASKCGFRISPPKSLGCGRLDCISGMTLCEVSVVCKLSSTTLVATLSNCGRLPTVAEDPAAGWRLGFQACL